MATGPRVCSWSEGPCRRRWCSNYWVRVYTCNQDGGGSRGILVLGLGGWGHTPLATRECALEKKWTVERDPPTPTPRLVPTPAL